LYHVPASYKLSGKYTWRLQYDDYFFVITGHATVTVKGDEPIEVAAGDFCRLHGGTRRSPSTCRTTCTK